MLIRLNIKNFLSFSERKIDEDELSHEFSMISGKVRNKNERIFEINNTKVLKFSAIYGANAAGKSNLTKALYFIKHTVIWGLPQGSSKMFCRTKPENEFQPSYFEIQFSIENHVYLYGFEAVLSKGEFISEWLVEVQNQNEHELFIRDIKNGKTELSNKIFKNKELYNKLKMYSDDISDDGSTLLITIMNKNKNRFYNDYPEALPLYYVFEWLNSKLRVLSPNRQNGDYTYMLNNANFDEICNILHSFSTGITGYQIVHSELSETINKYPKEIQNRLLADIEEFDKYEKKEKGSGLNIVIRRGNDFNIFLVDYKCNVDCLTIMFKHGDNIFSLSEESDGTVRLIDLLEVLLLDKSDDSTYIIDELDRCLHPCLTYNFVNRFLNLANKRNLQLIVTTHESRLLDFDLLRRDEIWFVDKNAEGESIIYSLDEFNERFDKKIDKAYLEGRYGGVPIFNTLFPIYESRLKEDK